ncbi:hypothetical protein EAY46_14830 [Vibrio anguillarum]|uniref:Uncharacterized protein n=3 Tax=Vibrio anguillarum TaxID=55601 RepID=A0ABR9Z797_VIBAN|nr:hypothetical protein [Vibrio anguillarum]
MKNSNLLAEKMNNEYKQLMQDKFASAETRAITTAESETKNIESEDRYSGGESLTAVCQLLNQYNAFGENACDRYTANKKTETIESAMNGEASFHKSFFEQVKKRTDSSLQPTDEKRKIESMGMLITEASNKLGRYELLNDEQFKDVQSLAQLIFMNNIQSPSAKQIIKTQSVSMTQLKSLQQSLLLQSVVISDIDSRHLINAQAPDRNIIIDGQDKKHLERLESINDAHTTYEVTRIRGTIKIKNLASSYNRLTKLHKFELLQALKSKALNGE